VLHHPLLFGKVPTQIQAIINQVTHDSFFVEFAPTTIDENKFAYVEKNKISMLMNHENNSLCDGYTVEFIHDAT
jgi:hypothetical protein